MDELLHAGFLGQVAERPEAVALIWPDGSMTYRELAAEAGRLAGRLRAAGVGPNSLVGVSAAKGPGQIVAVLGTVMAGGAYLPIDVELPAERRHHLVEHAGAAVVVTAPGCELSWPDGVTRFDAVGDEPSAESNPPARPAQAPEDLAYVIYTSGSTGMPKGVAMSHRATWNTIDDINERFAIGPDDRVLCLSSLSFDLSVYDVFGVLGAGGALVLPSADARLDPGHWLELCEAHRVTVWNSVPALMELATERAELGAPRPESLRLVMMSGDWIPVALPGRIHAQAPRAAIVGLGGATEAAIWSIFFPIEAVDPAWTSIPYGRALRGQSWQILNDRLNPCPAHVPGDLYIGGAGLADGYWRDEERTAASFITHPRTGERLYKTGDRGRFMADGNIEFLGRVDSQVKVGGHRIELGEIETHLAAHPSVRSAAVAAVGEERGHRRLVAFVAVDEREDGGEGAATEGDGGPEAALAGVGFELDDSQVAVTDPMERLEFRLRRHGRRAFDGDAPVALPDDGGEEERSRRYRDRREELRLGEGAIELGALGGMLGALRAVRDENGIPKHRYGSAGGLYPVQAYVAAGPHEVEGLPAGTYYYDPDAHALRAVAPGAELGARVHVTTNRALVERSAATVVLVADLDAIEPLYGAAARDFSLVEAGLVTQLLEAEALRHGLGLVQAAMPDTPELRRGFDLGERHLVLHGLLCGRSAVARQGVGGADRWGDLRGWLEAKLPPYMVPGQFLEIERVPLTSNGKVDRKALARMAAGARAEVADGANGNGAGPGPGGSPNGDAGGAEAAMLELILKEVGAVLGGDGAPVPVEPDAAFVDLGLDSLGAIQLRNRLEAAIGLSVPATIIFDYPTPRQAARWVAGDQAGDGDGATLERELLGMESRFRALAAEGSAREEIVARLRRLVGSLDSGTNGVDTDLEDVGADEILELVDRELGASGRG
jgi:amino acid adenylation domain-containing protein